MLIGELADRAGVSARALRHYEDCELLVPQRDANGYRMYAEQDLDRVRRIRGMIDAGLTTAVIRRYLDCARAEEHGIALEMCPELRAEVDAAAARIDQRLAALDDTRRRLCALTSGGTREEAIDESYAAGGQNCSVTASQTP